LLSLSPLQAGSLFGVYFIIVAIISYVLGKRIHTLRDYFLANQKLGVLPIAFSFAAAWFGAYATKGAMDAYYTQGLSGLWFVAIPGMASLYLVSRFLSQRIAQTQSMSMPQSVEKSYGKLGRWFLSWTILVASTTTLASQLVATKGVLAAALGVNETIPIIALLGGVVFYCLFGGFFAVALTDILQFFVLLLGLLILVVFCGGHVIAHPETMTAFWAKQSAGYWHLLPNPWETLTLTLIFTLAWGIAPEMWQRMIASQDSIKAKKASILATTFLLGLNGLVVIIGLLAGGVLGENRWGTTPEVLVRLAEALPSPILSWTVIIGFLAAVTSTMDSVLNVGSLTFTHDLYARFFRPNAKMPELLWVSRLATLIVPIPALWIALTRSDLIGVLWLSADVYACTMVVPIIGLLFTKTPNRLGGQLAMALGGSVAFGTILNQYHAVNWSWWTPSPYATLVGIGASAFGYLLGGWIHTLNTPAFQQDLVAFHYNQPCKNAVWYNLLLTPLSWGYGWIVTLRNTLYQAKLLNITHCSVPVISIGNITTGGTGKTPMTLAIAQQLIAEGQKVVILSRGYGAKTPQAYARAVSPDFGDEAFFLQQALPEAMVIVGKNRAKNALEAIADYAPTVILLDDGFQYQALHRDVNLVLVDASRLVGNGKLLPLGALREPLSALPQRATHVCLTRFEATQSVDELITALNLPHTFPVSTAGLQAVGWQTLVGEPADKPLDLLTFKGRLAMLISGIANPAQFETMVGDLGVIIGPHWREPDHANPAVADVRQLPMMLSILGFDHLIITTEKDAPKWRNALAQAEHDAEDEAQKQAFRQVLNQFYVLQVAFTVPNTIENAISVPLKKTIGLK
jgi:tetraacyldisaccharide 4'-kinase